MQLAIWDYPPAEFMVSARDDIDTPITLRVTRADMRQCAELLTGGQVDVALVPTLVPLTNPKAVDVLPAVALSTWAYPYAKILLRHGLSQIRSVAYDPAYPQEALLARIVLKEHYGMVPEFIGLEGASVAEIAAADTDARLVIGTEVATRSYDDLALDLGQEWFEHAKYPMVWGVFAMRKGTASPDAVRSVRDLVKASAERRRLWVQSQETSPALHEFYQDGLRVRFDDLAIASLTEFRQHLFYYDVVDDMPEMPFYFLPDEEEQDTDRRPLL